MSDRINEAIQACLTNGRRILDDDVSFLEFNDEPATAYFLTMIAQEEFAKAFLLALVSRGILPLDRHILRAARDHTCKQLLAVVMDHLHPDEHGWNARIRRRPGTAWPAFPRRVADAISILRFEKIGRWESTAWTYVEEPDYDRDALAIAEGKRDRRKQDALYVRLGADGGVASRPTATKAEVRAELDRAKRFDWCVRSVLEDRLWGFDDDEVRQAFRSAFEQAVT
jgi:AbiV family abortive infection protein